MNMIGDNALAMLEHQVSETIAELLNITTVGPENATRVKDAITNAKRLAKDIDDSRKLAKAPHIAAGERVDAAYKPLKEKVDEAWVGPNKMLEAWVLAEKRKADAIAAEARKAAEEAARKQAEQDAFLRDDEELARANTEAALAASRALAAQQVTSASGASRASSLRTYRFAEVKDAKSLVLHYAEHPDVLGAATKLANAAIRAAKGGPIAIPGVEIKTEERLA